MVTITASLRACGQLSVISAFLLGGLGSVQGLTFSHSQRSLSPRGGPLAKPSSALARLATGTRPRKDEQRAVASCATGAPAKGKSALTPKPRSNAVVGRSQFKTWVPAQFSQERRGPKARGP